MARNDFDNLQPMGFEQLTGINAATALASPAGSLWSATAGVPGTKARLAIFCVEGANVRWRDDGTAPTTSVGMRILKDTDMLYVGDLKAIRFIDEAGGGAAKVNVSYYK